MEDNRNKLASLGAQMEENANLLNPEDKYLPDGIDGIKRSLANTNKYHAAAMAVSDAADCSKPVYSDEDLKYKLSGKQFLLAIVIAFVLRLMFASIPAVVQQFFPEYIPNTQYELDFHDDVSKNIDMLESWGVDMNVAATNGELLTFVSKDRISIHKPGIWGDGNYIQRGDTVVCSFKSYPVSGASIHPVNCRYVSLTVNGKAKKGYVDDGDFIRMYKSALEQNDLKDSFKSETGLVFMNSSLKKEIKNTDSQIFEMGIYRPYNYPYNANMLRTVTGALGRISILVVLLAFTTVNLIRKKRANDAYMKKWNEESKLRWDEKQLNNE